MNKNNWDVPQTSCIKTLSPQHCHEWCDLFFLKKKKKRRKLWDNDIAVPSVSSTFVEEKEEMPCEAAADSQHAWVRDGVRPDPG